MHGLFQSIFFPCTSTPCIPFINSGKSTNFRFIYIFFMVSCNIFTLIFSSIYLFWLFQVCIHYLYSSYPCCSFLICFYNPYFPSSTLINLVLNDITSKPILAILRFTITIAWNISVILLLPNTSSTSSSIDFGVKFCGGHLLRCIL